MTPEAQQRLMEFASEVIARESSKLVESVQPGNGVELAGNLISVDASAGSSPRLRKKTIFYPGQLLVSDRVEVVPFIVPRRLGGITPADWLYPEINGRPIFSSSRPSLSRRSSGGAVYLICTFDIIETLTPGSGGAGITPFIDYYGVLKEVKIEQVSLSEKPPYRPYKAEIKVDENGYVPDNGEDASEFPKEGGTADSCFLLGCYNSEGSVFSRKFGDSVQDFTDPNDGGRGPHFIFPPSAVPVELTYT